MAIDKMTDIEIIKMTIDKMTKMSVVDVTVRQNDFS
jgi:hypothetical protein